MNTQEEAIYQTIAQCLLAGRLAPRTQLIEVRLAATFGVSRERIRKILHRLGHERLLEVIPNRGAFVADPTLEQARDIYEARRIIEGGIVGRLAGRLTAAQSAALEEHARREQAALNAGDRSRSIRLSGEFHVLLAECSGSSFVTRQLNELVSRTSMLVAFFEAATASACACEEHGDIVKALRAGDAKRALQAMHTHLSLIETRLTPRPAPPHAADPDQELARAWAEVQRASRPPARRRARVVAK
jgi:DNA-binding GntR family transcriptional regulator